MWYSEDHATNVSFLWDIKSQCLTHIGFKPGHEEL